MIYILVITALIIINFTNGISKLENKKVKNNLEIFILDNYKAAFGLIFLIITILFWRNSCLLLDFNC